MGRGLNAELCEELASPHQILPIGNGGHLVLNINHNLLFYVFRCIVPQITVLTPILDYGRCFLRHPYEHSVKLQNETDLPVKYELLSQHMDKMTPILYTSPKPKGVVLPNTVLDVPLVITPQGLEELDVIAQFVVFGCPEPPLVSWIFCNFGIQCPCKRTILHYRD